MARTRSDTRELIDAYTKKQVLAACGHRCAHCGKQLTLGKTFTLDHAVPLDKGGTNDMENFVALCYDCNQTKGNNVVHVEQYYTHLPDSKKTELQAYVDRFMSQHDWLQFNNLFKYDWFQTPYQRHILTGKGTKLLHTARSCTVSKLTPEQAVKMLQNYAGALPESARHRLISDPDHITDEMPFYAITDNGDGSILMGFALYIQPLTFVDPVTYEECSRNTVMIDLFRNPRACYSRIKSAYDVMGAVEIIFKQIQYSFGCKSPKTTIPGVIRGLMADTYLMKVFFDLAQTEYFHMPPRTPEHIEKYNLDPDIASLDFVLFQGDYKDLADITDGQMSLPFNKVLMKQDTIDQRLNASKAAMEEAEKKKKDESDLNAKLRKLRQSTDTKKKRRH